MKIKVFKLNLLKQGQAKSGFADLSFLFVPVVLHDKQLFLFGPLQVLQLLSHILQIFVIGYS
jgi:hypothetical protein